MFCPLLVVCVADLCLSMNQRENTDKGLASLGNNRMLLLSTHVLLLGDVFALQHTVTKLRSDKRKWHTLVPCTLCLFVVRSYKRGAKQLCRDDLD